MKKILIFISGLVIGGLICLLGYKFYFAPFYQWQQNTNLAARVEWQLIYKKNLDENKIDTLREVLELSLKADSENLIAMYKSQPKVEDPYVAKVIGNIKRSGVDLDMDKIDDLAKKLNR